MFCTVQGIQIYFVPSLGQALLLPSQAKLRSCRLAACEPQLNQMNSRLEHIGRECGRLGTTISLQKRSAAIRMVSWADVSEVLARDMQCMLLAGPESSD